MSINSPIIAALPNNLTNGTPNDASQVMADFNTVRNGVNNALSGVGANSGASYIGVTSDARWLGTSVQDALAQLISNTQINDTGTVNAIAFTTTPNITALSNNLFVWVKAGNTNTSQTVTLAAGTTAATGVVLNDGTTLPPIGSIIAGQLYGFWYSTGLSKWVLINPSRATGSVSSTGTGWTAGTTPVVTLKYSVLPDGNTIYVEIPLATGTSNATTASLPGLPSSFAPTTAQNYGIAVVNAGTTTSGVIFIPAGSSTLQFGNGQLYGPGGFTNSGSKSVPAIGGAGGVVTIIWQISP